MSNITFLMIIAVFDLSPLTQWINCRGQAIGASLQKIWKSHSIPISTKIRLMKVLIWPVATYGCESWTLRKNEETCIDAFEMKGLRKILRVSWTAKKTNEWVLNKAGVKRKLLDTIKARKLAYNGHTMRKQGSCLEKEIMWRTMPDACRRGRPRTALMDHFKTCGQDSPCKSQSEWQKTEINGDSTRMSMVWPTFRSRMAKEQNLTEPRWTGTRKVNQSGFYWSKRQQLQWHQLGHMQVCISLQTDNHASTPPLSFLQVGCPSCHPTNSVKALKAHMCVTTTQC